MSFPLLDNERFELWPKYDSAKSFYGKAYVTFVTDDYGAGVTLTSYETPIVSLYLTAKGEVGGVFWIHCHPADLSNTTWRHRFWFAETPSFRAGRKQTVLLSQIIMI
jgi:hypothetical protein